MISPQLIPRLIRIGENSPLIRSPLIQSHFRDPGHPSSTNHQQPVISSRVFDKVAIGRSSTGLKLKTLTFSSGNQRCCFFIGEGSCKNRKWRCLEVGELPSLPLDPKCPWKNEGFSTPKFQYFTNLDFPFHQYGQPSLKSAGHGPT